jgi:UDP-N-acetylglucosamine diphosphorylase/glucosamine-1-phosphate N-acetyltransferase
MNDKSVVAIIMAGGLGKRMESDVPKVLHKVCDVPMINHILIKLKQLSNIVNLEKIIVIVGKYKDQIQAVINEVTGINEVDELHNVVYVTQPEPQGTGHAIMCCKEELLKHSESDILILSGDVPLLSINTMQSLLNVPNDIKLVVTNLHDPSGYGRIVLKDGIFDKIVEQKDCTNEEVKITTVNCGIYCIKSSFLTKYLSYLNNNNKQGEYYLTDIVEIIKTHENLDIGLLQIDEKHVYEILGVNTIQQLRELEEIMRNNKKID